MSARPVALAWRPIPHGWARSSWGYTAKAAVAQETTVERGKPQWSWTLDGRAWHETDSAELARAQADRVLTEAGWELR